MAESILQTFNEKPTKLVIHVGVNNVDTMSASELANRIFSAACIGNNKRKSLVHETNTLLDQLIAAVPGKGIEVIRHPNLSTRHLHDDRHLRRSKGPADILPATLIFAKNLYMNIWNTVPSDVTLQAA